MFERRLKIFLALLVTSGLVLFGRAFSLQVLSRDEWSKEEHRLTTRPPELTETSRGRILDVRGTPLAVDTACTDAVVDYRAIVDPPDPRWVEQVARGRLKARYGSDFGRASTTFKLAQRKQMLADASREVTAEVATMWDTLALLYRPSDADAAAVAAANPRAAMDEVRAGIVRQVEMRRRLLWTLAYRKGEARSAEGGRLLHWLGLSGGNATGGTDAPDADTAGGPDIDSYAVTTGEQQASHVVLHALDADACNFLGKRLEQMPGLTLRPSTHRSYPLDDIACHVLGQTAGPSAEQIKGSETEDVARRYEPTETNVGREGVEALCEPLLRGTRGRIDRRAGDGAIVSQQPFVPGQDARLSIDVTLQAACQGFLKHVVEHGKLGDDLHAEITPQGGADMHGAIVVIDVKTNEVRALASNPTFNVNELETRFGALNDDVVNGPLTNRATSDAVEPGSTVKPMLGSAAVTQGTVGPLEGIECTGYMYLPTLGSDGKPTGQRTRLEGGRCWVASEFGAELRAAHMGIDHHHAPSYAQHRGHDGNGDGWLTLSDAIERSCDIYFETVADRMGPNLLCHWYDLWGIGRVTGIGIHEARGLREDQTYGREGGVALNYRRTNCLAGMGQDKTLATPLQIANAAAAIARGGIWMRPRLLTAGTQAALDAVHPRPAGSTPDRIDLHLSPAALEQTRIGMRNVVVERYPGTNELSAGTGQLPELSKLHPWLTVAAKTGTADTSPFTYLAKGPDGRLVRMALKPLKRGDPEESTRTPWYRSETGKGVVHAWYMGYAPVEDPQVAFAVLIEYAGIGGGAAAAPVASKVLDACVAGHYIRTPGEAATQP